MKHCYTVNEKGFFSIYAILLISIYISMISMLASTVKTYTYIRTNESYMDVCVLHKINQRIDIWNNTEIQAEEDFEQEGEKSLDDYVEEDFSCLDNMVEIQKKDTSITAYWQEEEEIIMHVYLDESKKQIIRYEYE